MNSTRPARPSPTSSTPASIRPPRDQVFLRDFYPTTNHPTQIRHGDEWIEVENVEMDCAIVVDADSPERPRAYTKVLNAIEAGVVEEGVMYQCVESDVPYVLAGSIRDDGSCRRRSPMPSRHKRPSARPTSCS